MTSDDFASRPARWARSNNSPYFFAHCCDGSIGRCAAEVSTFVMRLPIPSANTVATISIAAAPVLHSSLHCDLKPGCTGIMPPCPSVTFRLIRITMLPVMACTSSLMPSAPLPRRSRPSDPVPTLQAAAQASCRRRAEQHTRPAAGAVRRQPGEGAHTRPEEVAHKLPEEAAHRRPEEQRPPAWVRRRPSCRPS